ncbi:MAG: response regulator [Pseudobdellovibrio sp.]|nr:response regulator [Pseudobdellovibrio sp.]
MISKASGKILIIEDDSDIAFVLKTMIELDGYVVLTAENGQVALDLIKSEGPFQLIFLDMQMPVMNGWSFAETFYSLYGHTVPIVVMTAAADSKQRAKEVKANDCLAKPFEITEFQAMVKKYLPI